jgi:hypothetical protein
MKRCETLSVSKPLACNQSLDVIILLDGSGSLGKTGWTAEITALKLFIEAFQQPGSAPNLVNMALILFSGPRTWSGVYKCTGKSASSVPLAQCGIVTVAHFTDNLAWLDQQVTALQWPMGSTLTSLALMTAKAEMSLGRSDIHTIVVVFTDGRPLSYRKTEIASHTIRKAARLVWVPITKYAPLAYVKMWATRRWQENVIPVEEFSELQQPETITHIVADICPKESPKMEFTRR